MDKMSPEARAEKIRELALAGRDCRGPSKYPCAVPATSKCVIRAWTGEERGKGRACDMKIPMCTLHAKATKKKGDNFDLVAVQAY